MRSGGIFGPAITGGEKGKTEKTIRIHALDDLYDLGIFKYECR